MHFIKKNFVFILLVVSSLSMGVLALVTALRLREFRDAAPKTSALTPSCTTTFSINDTTPRDTSSQALELPSITPPITIIAQGTTVKPTPTSIKSSGTLLSGSPTPTIKPTATPTKKPSSTPTPTKNLLAQASITPTRIPTIVQPNLPVSGELIPTYIVLSLGFLFLSWGILVKKYFKVKRV